MKIEIKRGIGGLFVNCTACGRFAGRFTTAKDARAAIAAHACAAITLHDGIGQDEGHGTPIAPTIHLEVEGLGIMRLTDTQAGLIVAGLAQALSDRARVRDEEATRDALYPPLDFDEEEEWDAQAEEQSYAARLP